MSVVAVVLVKDEADVAPFTLPRLAEQVDEVVVVDNGSTDGTDDLLRASGFNVRLVTGGYLYSATMEALAAEAAARGHDWVVFHDADEVWVAPDGAPLGEWLGKIPDSVTTADGWHHNFRPTGLDDASERDPVLRMSWREPGLGWHKVAARASAVKRVGVGAHSVEVAEPGACAGGLVVRHYQWRSLDQHLAKIRRGIAAQRTPGLRADDNTHWTRFERWSDAEIGAGYWREVFVADPAGAGLVLDPLEGP